MRCAGAISGPDVRQFALAQRQSGRRGAACSLVSYRTLALSTQRLLFLHSKRSPNRRPAGLDTTRSIPGPGSHNLPPAGLAVGGLCSRSKPGLPPQTPSTRHN